MNSLEQILRAAESEGRYESTGQFTLAVELFKNRIGQDFATTYPSQYILRFIQSMVAFEASVIEVNSYRRTLELSATIASKRQLGAYLALALEHQSRIPDGDPTQPFLHGLWAALAENVEVKLQIRQSSRIDVWHCHAGDFQREVLDCSDNGPEAVLALSFGRPSKRRGFEAKLLQLRCGYCPIRLQHNGRRLDGSAWPEEFRHHKDDWYSPYAPLGFRVAEQYLENRKGFTRASLGLPSPNKKNHHTPDAFEWAPTARNTFYFEYKPSDHGYSAALYIPIDLKGPGTLVPVLHGVTLQPIQTHELQGGCTAVVECLNWGLKTDIFGLRLVETPRVAELKSRLRQEFRQLARQARPSLGQLKAAKPNRRLSRLRTAGGLALLGTSFLTGLGMQFAAGGASLLAEYFLGPGKDDQRRRNLAFSEKTKQLLSERRLL